MRTAKLVLAELIIYFSFSGSIPIILFSVRNSDQNDTPAVFAKAEIVLAILSFESLIF